MYCTLSFITPANAFPIALIAFLVIVIPIIISIVVNRENKQAKVFESFLVDYNEMEGIK